MFLNIFSNQTFTHNLELFFWLLGAFIIGLIFGKMTKKPEDKNIIEKTDFEDAEVIKKPTSIRATKTFERGGVQTIDQIDVILDDELDFNKIGFADKNSKDNLKLIAGIGSTIENNLNEIGIFNFNQISNLTEEDIKNLTNLIKSFPGRIERDNWVEQAKKLLKKKN